MSYFEKLDLGLQSNSTPATLVELLQQRAAATPDREAFSFLLDGETQTATWTFAELDRQARQIAARLQSLGLESGTRCLLVLPPGLDYVASFFGCLYAGLVAVPVYPPRLNRPMPRLQAIINDSQATVALTTQTLKTALLRQMDTQSDLARLQWLAVDESDHPAQKWQPTDLRPDKLAFLQYTSGSTATPKGVMLTHANLLHNLSLIQQAFKSHQDSVGVIWLPPYHDMGLIGGILQPIYYGGKSVLMTPAAFLQRPLRWLEAISRWGGTISGGPNFAYEMCLQKITPEQRQTLDLSSWEIAFNGAEPVRADTLERFAATFAACGFKPTAAYPCYGLAEATLIVSGGRADQKPVTGSFARVALSEGRAVPATADQSADDINRLVGAGGVIGADQQILIVEPESRITATPGQIGEIWVKGQSIAVGYWQQPEASERTFRASTADTGDGPFLRTGDLGFLEAGELFVTGRLKDLIIIRGRNHYPQDIELTVERSQSAVRSGASAAFAVELNDTEQLVVVAEVEREQRHSDLSLVAGAIRQAVAAQHELAIYEIVFLKPGSIPKTSSGKIQHHACRAGYLADTLEVIGRDRLAQASIALENETAETTEPIEFSLSELNELPPAEQEVRLQAYLTFEVAQVLQLAPAQLDPAQPLTNYGLDSLQAIEVQHRLETNLNLALPTTSLLEGPSLNELTTQLLELLREGSSTLDEETSVAGDGVGQYPLSAGQRAMWFLYQLAPDSAAYNIATAVRLRSALDIPALESALTTLAERQSSLRTIFKHIGGEPYQEVLPVSPVRLKIEEIPTTNEDEWQTALLREARQPFDLQNGPVWRVSLFRRADGEQVLVLTVHHIVADLWSMTRLVQELDQLYPAAVAGTQTLTLPLKSSYGEYARRQATGLSGPTGETAWRYWQEKLKGDISPLELPFNYPRPPVQTYEGASLNFAIEPDMTRRLKSLCEKESVTLYTALAAVFQALLYRYTGQTDFVIGSPTSGRTQRATADLIGYFVNPVVLRADLTGQPTFYDLLKRARQTVLEALEHQDYPFPLLVERLQPQRDPSRSPLFQVLFSLQKAPQFRGQNLVAFALSQGQTRLEMGGLELEAVTLEQNIAQFDLGLTMGEINDGLDATFDYNLALFARPTIERMAEHFRLLLEALLDQPDQKSGSFRS